jgi:hypothetical protein
VTGWKLVTVAIAVVAATAGIAVAEATEETESALVEVPCEEFADQGVAPNEVGCYRVEGDPSNAELHELACDLPLPAGAPPDARKPPFCDEPVGPSRVTP